MTIDVTEADIRSATPGDCFRCAVAIALQRATEDESANVYEWDCMTYMEVHGRHILAPSEVMRFAWEYDSLERDGDGRRCRAVLPDTLPADLAPFAFELPEQDDTAWLERCYLCEELFPPAELDGEGQCCDCCEEGAP